MRSFLKMDFGIEKAPRHFHFQNGKPEIIGIFAGNLDPLGPVLGIHHGHNLAVIVFPDAHENPILKVILDVSLH